MAYSATAFRNVENAMADRRSRALGLAQERRAEAARRCPEIAVIDEELAGTGMSLFKIACGGGENKAQAIAELRARNEQLNARKRECLLSVGLTADYTEVPYTCPVCKDNGYDASGAMCTCMKKLLAEEEVRLSGIGALVDRQSFESFSLDGATPSLRKTFEICRDYADGFSLTSSDLLLCGATGLGKTHLSTAIAKRVIDKGYRVVYESMLNVVDAFHHDQKFSTKEPTTGRFFDAELLILDDVGAELPGAFATTVLYQIINTRQNKRLPTVISTNLLANELMARYDARISSRLLGGFRICLFEGRDHRIF